MKHLITITLLFVLLAAGCNSSRLSGLYQVKGKITLQGQPAAGVVVTFSLVEKDPAKRPASAVTAADGSFVLTTLQAGDGAYPGKYKVVLGKFAKADFTIDGVPPAADTMPLAYRSPETTPLEVEVVKGKNKELLLDVSEPLVEPVFPPKPRRGTQKEE
jgi:5-hydroxyisourate hydrolase-like protein (transthyretin family)